MGGNPNGPSDRLVHQPAHAAGFGLIKVLEGYFGPPMLAQDIEPVSVRRAHNVADRPVRYGQLIATGSINFPRFDVLFRSLDWFAPTVFYELPGRFELRVLEVAERLVPFPESVDHNFMLVTDLVLKLAYVDPPALH